MTKVYNLGTGIIFSLQSNPFKKKQTMILVAVPSWTLPRPEYHQDIYHNLRQSSLQIVLYKHSLLTFSL